MPHAVIEHSNSLTAQVTPHQLAEAAFQGCVNADLFKESQIRVRTKAYETFTTGGKKRDFLHICLRILSGRSNEQKQQLTTAVMKEVNALKLKAVTITVEVVDLHRESYVVEVIN